MQEQDNAPPAGGATPQSALQGQNLADQAIALGMPVFPCDAEKKPLTPAGFKNASSDPAAIRRMFSHPAAALIGVPTGPVSGFVVVDVDVADGKRGADWLERNIGRLPETRAHQTRSGGLHLVFRQPEGVEVVNSQSRVAPGVDVRGQGGYVIVPPSPGYSIAVDAIPAEMPAWLVEACQRRPEPMARPLVRRMLLDTRDAGARRLLALVKFVATAPEGERNARLFWASCRAGNAAMLGEMPATEATAALEQAAHAAGLRGLEVQRTILSGFRSAFGGRTAA